jgi:hypothetical protein
VINILKDVSSILKDMPTLENVVEHRDGEYETNAVSWASTAGPAGKFRSESHQRGRTTELKSQTSNMTSIDLNS